MNKKGWLLLIVVLLLLVGGLLYKEKLIPESVDGDMGQVDPVVISSQTVQSPPKIDAIPSGTTTLEDPQPPSSPKKIKPPKDKGKPSPKIITQPSPVVKIHKELIPKNIDIVRFYYGNQLTGPGSALPFDINGSGFTEEFEKMITVKSGHDEIKITNLKLKTLNQIEGIMLVGPKTPTGVYYPQVLIQDKVVFQAPDPFGVVRPNDVLNVFPIEMGESGRSGRFRVYTNLTDNMYQKLHIIASTHSIEITDITPNLPFVVDMTINVGTPIGGEYGLTLLLDGKTVWKRDDMIRVVRPHLGQSGLVQKIVPMDGFHRPGDKAQFLLQGSGFRNEDIELIRMEIDGLDINEINLSYVSPGRMQLEFILPDTAEAKDYTITLKSEDTVLFNAQNIFRVVPNNWLRGLRVDPMLIAGGKSTVYLDGRSMNKEFVDGLRTEVDTEKLKIEKLQWISDDQAKAVISAEAELAPGDYWVKIYSNSKLLKPQFGSIIRVNAKPK